MVAGVTQVSLPLVIARADIDPTFGNLNLDSDHVLIATHTR
jgi:hypothetical protein